MYVLLTILVFVFLTIMFWSAKNTSATKEPTRLNLRGADSAPLLMEVQKNTSDYPNQATFTQHVRPVKELCIYFNYNDHSWEAHEVLGVPHDAGLVEVTEAYQKALKSTSGNSHEFLEVAYMSILKKRKQQL